MKTEQVVRYDASLKIFTLYRGGYDEMAGEGLDPYDRDSFPLSTAKGYYPAYPIKQGATFYYGVGDPHSDSARMLVGKFFFGEEFDLKKTQTVKCQLKMCFDSVGRVVFWKEGTQDPERISKFCKSRKGSFYKNWIRPFTEYSESTPPVEVKGLKFQKNQPFLIADIPDYYFSRLIPEYGDLKFSYSTYQDNVSYWKHLEELPIIDLSKSWDYTEDEKKEIDSKVRKIKEEREQARAELEERKATPGYCDCCGEPAAYVVDPYQEEMYGYRSKRWLCSSCYNSLLGDI